MPFHGNTFQKILKAVMYVNFHVEDFAPGSPVILQAE